MADFMSRYKGKYRVLAEYDMSKNDYPRDANGNIDQSIGMYITCQKDVQIYAYGRDGHREMQLCAYIPSLTRGRNIKKMMKQNKIDIHGYDETDSEVSFRFSSNDIDAVAEILGAKTRGKDISPFSTSNLPKSTEKLPQDEMDWYKSIVSKVKPGDFTIISKINKRFLDEVLAKKLREKGKRKPFDYMTDKKQMGLAKDVKLYIFKKGMYGDYLSFLDSAIDDYYNGK